MNKKNLAKKTAALLMGVALAVGGVGCGNFIVTDSAKDLAQTVATVDISKALKADNNPVATDVETIVGYLSTDIKKRDLVAYFLSTGYQNVQSLGYEATFNMLMDQLVSNEIMTQYAIAYYLGNENGFKANVAKCNAFVNKAIGNATGTTKKLLQDNKSVLVLTYFLTEDGTKMEEYARTEYALKKSINEALDSLEQNYIKASSDEHDHEEPHTLPNGVDTEKADYYDVNYDVYTGRNVIGEKNTYKKQDGSTTSTRQKAYNAFLANLQGYNMISTTGATEDTSNVTELNYYYVELSSMLGQALVNKYFKDLEDSVVADLDAVDENGKTFVERKYAELLESQEKAYAKASDFETAMDGVSDTSFLLHGKKNFGYVYNILLPFSESQEDKYTRAKNNTANSQDYLYNYRKELLEDVKGKDQRGSWISEHDHANYATEIDGKYYFFQDRLEETTKYEGLTQYLGNYAYDGTVTKNADGEFEVKPDKISIDEFIDIFNDYINECVGEDVASGGKIATYGEGKYDTVYEYEENDTKKVDYSKFAYYAGKVNGLGDTTAKDYFNADSKIYKAVSAVNELMFAYSTDPGCLNTYFGYAVSPYGTDFVKEFEWAAWKAIEGGVGSYVVCATDLGWHIIFASFVYDDGEVYEGGYSVAEATVEGSFSNLFYESLKESTISNYSTEVRNTALNKYNNDESVTLYKSHYQDLLDLDK